MKDEELVRIVARSIPDNVTSTGKLRAGKETLANLRAHGLEVVSVEPTPQMCQTYYDLCRKEETLAVAASDIWRAMLSATKGG